MSLTRKLARQHRREKQRRGLLRQLRKSDEEFYRKFGRNPTDNDPLIWDPDYDTPTPLSVEKYNAQLLEAMRSSGTPARLIYAYQKTGRIVTEDSYELLSKEAQREWDAAIQEYLDMEDDAAEEKPQ